VSRKEPILRIVLGIALAALVSLSLAGPAHAAGAVALPDPSGGMLFALGVAGVLVGRRFAGKRKD
jgi:hypothetical protein